MLIRFLLLYFGYSTHSGLRSCNVLCFVMFALFWCIVKPLYLTVANFRKVLDRLIRQMEDRQILGFIVLFFTLDSFFIILPGPSYSFFFFTLSVFVTNKYTCMSLRARVYPWNLWILIAYLISLITPTNVPSHSVICLNVPFDVY